MIIRPDSRKRIRIGKQPPDPFPFKTITTEIVVILPEDKWYLKEVEAVTLGAFGYHHAFSSSWNVFSLENGCCIARYEKERDARVTIKRLFSKIDVLDLTKNEELTLWLSQVFRIIKDTPRMKKDVVVEETAENYEDDIPF